MTFTMLLSALCALLFGALLGWVAGWIAGYERGRAFGWQEGYFRRRDDEAAKHDKLGRWVGRKGKST